MDVVVVSGHMVDTPDRERPRFPANQIPRVAQEIREVLRRWDLGPGATLVTGGARGADILAAEIALRRGAEVHLVLAFAPETFKERSVALPGTDWEERFDALVAQSEYEVVGGPDEDVYERTNDRIIELARGIDERPHALIVWNGEGADGAGGTSDFVQRLGHVSGDERLVIIAPMPS